MILTLFLISIHLNTEPILPLIIPDSVKTIGMALAWYTDGWIPLLMKEASQPEMYLLTEHWMVWSAINSQKQNPLLNWVLPIS